MRIRAVVLVGLAISLIAGSIILSQEISRRTVDAAGGGGCPNLYFQGGYGFAGHGFITMRSGQVPIAIAGGFIAAPNLTVGATNGTIFGGTETSSRQGSIGRLTFTGTFKQTRAWCGGSAVITSSPATPQHYDYWLNQWSSGIAQEIDFISTDPGMTTELTVTHV